MSSYKNFYPCAVCRGVKNWKNYKGPFDVTMLLSTFYLVVMFPVESRIQFTKNISFSSDIMLEHIGNWLEDHSIFKPFSNNKFNAPQIAQNLRHGLAHFNIKINEHTNPIQEIKIFSINDPNKSKKYYAEDEDESICTYTFTVTQLEDFIDFMADMVLKNRPHCNKCTYKSTDKFDGTPDPSYPSKERAQ